MAILVFCFPGVDEQVGVPRAMVYGYGRYGVDCKLGGTTT